ncbi:MAG: tRNA adenosine(34) deaminase TadA [Thermodesulfobacteriota bacterium]|nr:tRNA adenosine(34) deaminase TadA [Thermodesulfobacteriota bacterium]
MHDHEHYMKLALAEAEKGRGLDEVPVGAVLVSDAGDVLAAACNRPISSKDPTAHAEILVLRMAAGKIGNYRLPGTTLYVTVEPCAMCMGAIIHARVGCVVFGVFDPKWGCAGSLYNFTENRSFNHQPDIVAGVCETACRHMLQSFFEAKRNRGKKVNPVQ